MFGLGFSRPRDTRKLARRFLENVENTSQSGKRARTKWTPHSKSKGRARHMIPKRFSMVQEAAAKRQTNLVRLASPVYPSASDLCSQLVGNSGIRSVKFTDLNSWQCGLHSARISLSGENIPQADNK